MAMRRYLFLCATREQPNSQSRLHDYTHIGSPNKGASKEAPRHLGLGHIKSLENSSYTTYFYEHCHHRDGSNNQRSS